MILSEKKRVALNVFASYARSVYGIILGLIAGRWTLMALGESDYGLMGLIGGLTTFVTFLNSQMAFSVGRFYAYEVGAAQRRSEEAGIEECKKWFNTSLLIHTVLPIVLMLIGYPVGIWAINNYLTIPVDRVQDCVIGWRLICLSCFINMISVPFRAMYGAKQEIAELTLYSFATSTLHVFFLYYIVNHEGKWLLPLMAWNCFLTLAPQLIICIRAISKYRECRFVLKYLWSGSRMRQVMIFCGGRLMCSVANLISSQGQSVLVNKMLGPTRNAAMSVGGAVCENSLKLASAFLTGFSPVITNAAGAKDYEKMRRMMYATCMVSTLALLIFALPLTLEVNEVMRLWLKTPPLGSGAFCLTMLLWFVFDRISDGLWMGIFAMGKVVKFQTWESILWYVVIPIAYVFVKLGGDIVSVGMALALSKLLAIPMKLYFSRNICGISIRYWLMKIAVPIIVVSAASLCVGLIPRLLLSQSLYRVIITTAAIEVVFLPLSWFYVLPLEVRGLVSEKLRPKLQRLLFFRHK